MSPVHDSAAGADEPEIDIAVVGGGISGLYCALQLARLITVEKRTLHVGGKPVDPAALQPVPVHLYESSGGLGGRIETWTVSLTPEPFGVRTVEHPYERAVRPSRARVSTSGPSSGRCASSPAISRCSRISSTISASSSRAPREESDYDLTAFPAYSAEEPLEPKFTLHGEEAEQSSLLDLLLLAVRRICELVAEEDQQIPAASGR